MTEREIFTAALERNAAERAAFLGEACAGDAELRQRVQKLLAEHEQLGSFLEGSSREQANAEGTIDLSGGECPGVCIGHYKLLQQIGEGGFGLVFMAEQTAPVRRKVAIKVIKPGMDTRQVIARFEAERQALAVMDHPNIARVLDAGATDSGRPYFVMELVRGVPITAYCDEASLTVRERLSLFAKVCQAIQHAHTKGIIHRDIKPSNVLITRQDGEATVKVIDFGIAKAMGQQLTEKTLFTDFRQMIGTPLYMSPEQAELSSVDIDTRSDVYSLGVLLYELLTGTTPVDKEQLKQAAFDEVRRIIREEEPPRPSTRISTAEAAPSIAAHRHTEPAKLARLVRGELDWIVMKALEKDRNRRYETASGLARDVERYLNDEPVQACPPSALYRFRKLAGRYKAALATSALIAALLVIAVVALAISNVRIAAERNAKDTALAGKVKALGEKETALVEKQAALRQSQASFVKAKQQEKLAKEQQIVATEQTHLARRRLYAAQMNLAMQAWRAGEAPRVLELLESQRPGTDEDDLRGFEWYYLWRLCNGGRRLYLHGHTDAVLGLAYSPDGTTLASASWDGSVRLWDAASGKPKIVLRGHKSSPWTVVFSPDGKSLASSGKQSDSLIIWDVATGKPRHTIPGPVVGFAFSRDSSVIAGGVIAQTGLDVKLWDAATGAERMTIAGPGAVLGFLPGDKMLATMTDQFGGKGAVELWDLEAKTRRLKIAAPVLISAALSPDGSRIATSTTEVAVWDTATGERLTSLPQVEMRALAFSPDNKRLAMGNEQRTVSIWDIETGRKLGEEIHLDPVWSVAFSPDGKTLASSTAAGAIKLWDLTPADEATTIPVAGPMSLAFDATGRSLLVGNSGSTMLIDVVEGKEAATLPFAGAAVISADANVLAAPVAGDRGSLWDVSAGSSIGAFPLVAGVELGISLSPSGKKVATFYRWSSDNTVRVWDADAREEKTLTIVPPYSSRSAVHCVEFSPDGKLLAAGFQFQWVTVWDVASGRIVLEFWQPPAMMWVRALAFSPDGKALAVGTDVGAVTLWEIATGKRLASFRGHTSNIRSLAFSGDGKTLASASDDKTVRLWDVVTGQERATLIGHQELVLKVRFSPDDATLATAGGDGTVKLWRAATDEEARARRYRIDADDPNYIIATTHRRTAWYLATTENLEERDPAKAVSLAEKAISLFPKAPHYWLTLGIARYRAANWRGAIAALDKCEEIAPGHYTYMDFFRAMALWRLGEKDLAQNAYRQAEKWVGDRAPHDPWFVGFHREAAEVLELPAPKIPAVTIPPGSTTRAEKLAELKRRRMVLDECAAPPLTDRWDRWRLATDYYNLAVAMSDAEQLSDAEALIGRSLDSLRTLAQEDPQQFQFYADVGFMSHHLAGVLARRGHFQEAETPSREALARLRDVAATRPDSPEYQDAVVSANVLLASILRQLNRPEEAAQAERDAEASRAAAAELRLTLPSARDALETARPFADTRDWKLTAAALDRAFERQPRSDMFLCFSTALARLLAGDVDGYARLAASLPAHQTSRLSRWERLDVLRISTIHPRGTSDAAALLPLAQQAYDDEANNWSAQNLGMAYYRAGRFSEARQWIEKAMQLGEWHLFFPALAMTHHQLGQTDEARRWLDKAEAYFRDMSPPAGEDPKTLKGDAHWQDWAYFEVMLREAMTTIGENSSP